MTALQTNWILKDLVLFAKLANQSYETDSKAGFEALGTEWLGQVGDPECQATLANWMGYSLVVIRGTQVGQNPSLPELWDDIDPGVTLTPGGHKMCSGFWNPLKTMWPAFQNKMGAGVPLIIGHSLGGVRAQLAKALCPPAYVVSFGAPCGADPEAWKEIYQGQQPTRLVNRQDFAPRWTPGAGWFWDCNQPGPMLWMTSVDTLVVTYSQGFGIPSLDDHSIDKAYIPNMEKIAAGV